MKHCHIIIKLEIFDCCRKIFDLQKIFVLTLDDNDAVGGVGAEAVGGDALVLAAVAGLAVDDLDGDDAVRVRDREEVRRQWLAGLRRYVDKYSNNISIISRKYLLKDHHCCSISE